MRSRILPIQLDWLREAETPETQVDIVECQVTSIPQIPPDGVGHGQLDLMHLSLDMILVRSTFELVPETRGQMVRLKRVNLPMQSPTFLVASARVGRVFHQWPEPAIGAILENGRDLFGLTQHYDVTTWGEGGSSIDVVLLSLHLDTMGTILGEAETGLLSRALGIESLPTMRSHEMPRRLSALLHQTVKPTFTGPSRRLYAQVRALEYLSALFEHLRGAQDQIPPPASSRSNAQKLREQLLNLEGKLPTLEALAREYDMSARRLNAEFTREFGESIFAFITGQRLEQARVVLQSTDIPMKVLADRLGYSHVNHFITAFKNRFGQPPGAVRRQG